MKPQIFNNSATPWPRFPYIPRVSYARPYGTIADLIDQRNYRARASNARVWNRVTDDPHSSLYNKATGKSALRLMHARMHPRMIYAPARGPRTSRWLHLSSDPVVPMFGLVTGLCILATMFVLFFIGLLLDSIFCWNKVLGRPINYASARDYIFKENQ